MHESRTRICTVRLRGSSYGNRQQDVSATIVYCHSQERLGALPRTSLECQNTPSPTVQAKSLRQRPGGYLSGTACKASGGHIRFGNQGATCRYPVDLSSQQHVPGICRTPCVLKINGRFFDKWNQKFILLQEKRSMPKPPPKPSA